MKMKKNLYPLDEKKQENLPKRGKREQVLVLENLAKEVLKLKTSIGQRRPLLIEFCGTPNSGKTTTINSLNTFFKRNEFQTVVIQEMASICPIKNKTHYFFNSWTLFMSLAEIIKQMQIGENKLDLILVDRSLFDALCWFEWLSTNSPSNPYIDEKQYEAFQKILIGTEMWTVYFDIIYIFKSNPDVALDREFAELLTEKRGNIMNETVLGTFNIALENTKEKYLKHFRKIQEYDTSYYEPNTVSYDVTLDILQSLKELLTEKIGYFLESISLYLKDGINDFDVIRNREIFFGERNMVEDQDYIQPVAIAVITNIERNKILVLKKNDNKTEKNSPEHRRLLLYAGGHTRLEDRKEDDEATLITLNSALYRELKEELNESITINDKTPFLIYTPTTEKSRKHLAVCFVIEMDLENKTFSPTADEFILKTSSTKSGTIMSISDLIIGKEKLEPWSEAILKHVFNMQKTLFG